MTTVKTVLDINKGSKATIITKGIQGVAGASGDTYGWAWYRDSQYTEESPLALTGGETVVLTNDLQDFAIDKLVGDFENHNFFVNNEFVPQNVDDVYLLRINFDGKSSTTSNNIKLQMDIGPDETPAIIFADTAPFDQNVLNSRLFSFDLFFFVGAGFFTNNAKFKVTAEQNATIWRNTYLITPLYKVSS